MSALELIDSWDVPHAGVAVIDSSGLVATRGDIDRVLRIASVSKLLTAYAVLIGVQEGAVELDDPAGPPGATLRHLLAHTAGYGFDSDAPVVSRPGSRRIYSNRGVEEAAAHLERSSGVGFADYLGEAVLEPLGMAATDPGGSPAHGIRSTVGDLARFAAEVLSPKLLAEQTLAEMMTVQFPGLAGVVPGVGRFDPCDWGLGFERNFGRPGHWSGQAVPSGAGGHFGGSCSFLWVDRAGSLACVCLSGREFGPWAMQVWPPLCTAVLAEHAR